MYFDNAGFGIYYTPYILLKMQDAPGDALHLLAGCCGCYIDPFMRGKNECIAACGYVRLSTRTQGRHIACDLR